MLTLEQQRQVFEDAAETIREGFKYEACGECGGDIDDHHIVPGPFGLPFAWCGYNTGEEVAE